MGSVARVAPQRDCQLLSTPVGQHIVKEKMQCLMLMVAIKLPCCAQADPDQDPSEKDWQVWRWLNLHKKRG